MSPAAFVMLLFTACLYGANHVAARLAFNHGLDVTTAVAVRSLVTALVVGALVVWQGVPRVLLARQKKIFARDQPADCGSKRVPVFGGCSATGGLGPAGLQHLPLVDCGF